MDALRTCLQEAMVHIKQAVDLSAKIKVENPGSWKEANGMWEGFAGGFWQYIKLQSAKSGHNLLRGISLLRFKP
jgi:hypothetical protein